MAVPERFKKPANIGWGAAALAGIALGAVWLRFLATEAHLDDRTRDRLAPRGGR